MALIDAYDTRTGEARQVPEHWIGHPTLGVGLTTEPPAPQPHQAEVREPAPAKPGPVAVKEPKPTAPKPTRPKADDTDAPAPVGDQPTKED